ncbi:MAG: hypothetical protein LW710_10785 [Burkholderiales bacterium]|uniref:hypothetical protein n=1 Tax=Limnobacter sp. TaxID=2003368 RepID=UPI0039BD7163|nr:hypothetical protein [Burkholderiales bacterium]
MLSLFKDTSLSNVVGMLTLTGTIEPRVYMPIFRTYAAQINHLSVISMLGAMFALIPMSASSLEISTPVGIQQIGQPLNLKSTLSNMPEGAESQLRSTCLKARMHALETTPGTYESVASREVLVNFDPTIRRGGLLEFKSVMPVQDAVVEMELISECPLIVFSTKWTLIMKEGSFEPSRAVSSNYVKSASSFDPRRSSLLEVSRRPPPPKADTQATWVDVAERKETKPLLEEKEVATAAMTTAENKVEVASESVEVASLDANLLGGAGLIESRKETVDANGGLGLDAQIGQAPTANSLFDMLMPILLGIAALLMITLLAYWQYSKRRAQIHVSTNIKGPANRQAVRSEPKDLAAISREHVSAFSGETESASASSHRVLESLIGVEEQHFDAKLNSPLQDFNSGVTEYGNRSSLKISLELILRADIPSWKLPPSYLGLVEARNKSIELHKTNEALILRSHIGLVELAFQDAKQGQVTSNESALELLDKVLGERWYELDLQNMLSVPDLVKSHVRAKLCEVAGFDSRQLLRENLLNLNKQVTSSALCFQSNEWREFLSEEGILE